MAKRKNGELPITLKPYLKDFTEKELLVMLNESTTELLQTGLKENIEHLAINKVRNKIRKLTKKATFEPKAKATLYTGFIIGDGGMRDKANEIREKAKRFVEKNGIEAAIEQNIINADNQVLDTREKVYGKENRDYLKPLPETLKLRSRILYLIAKKMPNEQDYENGKTPVEPEFKYGTIQTNDNALAFGWNKVKFYAPCQIYGIVKEDSDEFKLNSSQAEDTKSVFRALKADMDIDSIIDQTILPKLTQIKDIESKHNATKDAWDRIIFVRGMVTWIGRDRSNAFGAIPMGLMATTEDATETRVYVPEWLSIDFGEESEIIVIGKTRRAKAKNEEGKWVDADIVIDAVGLYPLKGLTVPVSIKQRYEEEAEIEGWLEN